MNQRQRELPTQQITIAMGVGLALFIAALPFHLVIKRLIPGPVGTYWKEIVLGLVVALWVIRSLITHRIILTGTTIDLAVVAYLALLAIHVVLERSGWTVAWGFYVSAMYIPLAWLVPATLEDRPAWLGKLLWLLTGLGALVALGGIVEFVSNTALWPSDEMVERLGFPDMYIYGTHVRRVYFTFDSPTTLANTLALLLPLAAALAINPPGVGRRQVLARALAGLAGILMAGCIVLTFSRGIWVASAVGLAAFAAFVMVKYGDRRIVVGAACAVAVVVLVWGAAAILTKTDSGIPGQRIIELSGPAYAQTDLAMETSLVDIDPVAGDRQVQTWTLQDPVSSEDDSREVVFEHPSETGQTEITFQVNVPQHGALKFGIALAPDVWATQYGDGVDFQIYLVDPSTQERTLVFSRYANPKQNPSDRRWRNYVLDLSNWENRQVQIVLATTNGPAGDWGFDWSGWSDLQVGSVEPALFEASADGNAILRHTQSILNWTTDETNRDRIAAWSQGLRAWWQAPIRGNGLGTTGVAALRTQPRSALVTESQVLKALVELGLPGLLVLGWLWFEIARVGFRAVFRTTGMGRRILLLSIMASLFIVFIEGWVYQNLEVKQVNAYFWTLIGILAFLVRYPDEQ